MKLLKINKTIKQWKILQDQSYDKNDQSLADKFIMPSWQIINQHSISKIIPIKNIEWNWIAWIWMDKNDWTFNILKFLDIESQGL